MKVVSLEQNQTYTPALRAFAKLISIVLHPLFLPTYFFLWAHARFPYTFPGMDATTLSFRTFGVFWTTAFSRFVVFLLWRLKAVESMQLKTAKERIIPYITTMFFYWWMWYLSRNFSDQAIVLKYFYFSIFIATVPALILNNFLKISMHAIGVGGLITAIVIASACMHVYLGADILISLFLGSLVLSSRIILKEHTNKEIYLGFFIGIISQLIGYWAMK